mmetsp:Transcript_12772/g.22961  ORF Transcript_12772/g.22961 Transcript_12772/m.22961 type:complete len:481 (-) Transcript_12772:1386-2828(-)
MAFLSSSVGGNLLRFHSFLTTNKCTLRSNFTSSSIHCDSRHSRCFKPSHTITFCKPNDSDIDINLTSLETTQKDEINPFPSTSIQQTSAVSGVGSLFPAYSILILTQFIPFISKDYIADILFFTLSAACTLYIGAKRNMLEPVLEKLNPNSGLIAPVVGSGFLFGLYALIKYTDIDISTIYSTISTVFGCICLQMTLQPLMESILPQSLRNKKFQFPVSSFSMSASTLPRDEQSQSKISSNGQPDSDHNEVFTTKYDAKLSISSLSAFGLAVGCALLYQIQKDPHFFYSNLIAISIGLEGLSVIKAGSFVVAAGLLSGLFLYDCFWVFGSDVMLTVATKLDAPAKLLFPRVLPVGSESYPYAVLGLGDIVVPGLFAALMLTIDKELVFGMEANRLQEVRSGPYFKGAVIAYVVGLLLCFGVNTVTKAAQPALFYLVPAMIGSSVLVAAQRNELDSLLRFSSKSEALKDSRSKSSRELEQN